MSVVQDWLSQAHNRRPGHVFIRTPDTDVTFEEFEGIVRRAVGRLRVMGVEPGQRVAVLPDSDIGSAAAMFAVPRLGAEMVLINPRLSRSEIVDRLVRARATLALTLDDGFGVRTAPLELDGPEDDRIRSGAVHSIIFTSGSSGTPKGVRLTRSNLEASASGSAIHLGHAPDDRWLGVLGLYHVGGLQILIRSAREATTVVLEPKFEPRVVAERMKAGEVTLVSMVPTMLGRVLDFDEGPYPNLRAVLLGGGPIPASLKGRAGGLPILPTYGMTETASQIATARMSDPRRTERVFAIPGAEVRCDTERAILVRGPMVFAGYLDEPDRSSDEWFKTGDIGEIDGDGALRILGRSDDVIVTGGENVHPGEVEAIIRSHPGVDECAVIGYQDPEWGMRIVAVYAGTASPGELERHARYRLAGFKIPKQWVEVPELPRMSIGKVDRAGLRSLVAPTREDAGDV